MSLDTDISSPRLMRAWKRRSWIEHCFRTLKHLLATGACQVHREEAYYGHLVLRLMGCLVLFYTSRIICKGRMTMEEIIFRQMHEAHEADATLPVPSARLRHEATAHREVTDAVRECLLTRPSVWPRAFLALPLVVCPWYKTLATGRWSLLTQEERESCKRTP